MLYTGGVMRDLIYAVYWWGDGRSYICCILVGWWEILYMLYTGGVMGDLMLYTGGVVGDLMLYTGGVVGDLMLYTGGVMGDLIYAVYWWGDARSYICCILVG